MSTKRLVTLGILSTLSIVLASLIHMPLIPAAPYLQYDLGDLPILIGTFAFGPAAGLLITAVTSLLMAAITGLGGPIGAVMHFLASGSLAIVAGSFYIRSKTIKGAISGLIAGTIALAAVMVVANLILTPLYLNVPREKVIPTLLPVVIPFNLLRGLISSVLTIAVYKRISPILKR